MVTELLRELNGLCFNYLNHEMELEMSSRINFILFELIECGYTIICPTIDPNFNILQDIKNRDRRPSGFGSGQLKLQPHVYIGVANSNKHLIPAYYLIVCRKVWFKYKSSIKQEYFKIFDPNSKIIFYFPNGDTRIWER